MVIIVLEPVSGGPSSNLDRSIQLKQELGRMPNAATPLDSPAPLLSIQLTPHLGLIYAVSEQAKELTVSLPGKQPFTFEIEQGS